jgi:predicted ester cyclase
LARRKYDLKYKIEHLVEKSQNITAKLMFDKNLDTHNCNKKAE